MQSLLKLSAIADRLLAGLAKIGAWAGVLLIATVMYDVITRYLGLPRGFGLNATQIQESEYWLHTILFSLFIGYAYTRQGHVRIDLVRDRLSTRVKYLIEVAGISLLLIPFCLIAINYNINYAVTSFNEGEISKSVIGLTNIWILKSFLPLMFILLLIAAVSQLIKSLAGLLGVLPEEMISETLGGDL